MGNSNLVRFSRDGDQFHYLWAARRCLRLLSPLSRLVAIAIEGASTSETKNGDTTEAGEEIIDVAEYYGSEDLKKSDCIRYIQLKHSTQHSNDPWPPSGLEKTLHGFAKRYKSLEKQLGAEALSGKLEFWFVSNRPINSNFLEVVDDTANKVHTRHTEDLKKLRKFTRLNGSKLSAFCKILSLQGNHDNYWEQRNMLLQDTSKYLPDGDVDAPIQLKELVTRKALSESAENPTITKMDVLRVLKTDESRLLPAPCLIKVTDGVVPREQEADLIAHIINSKNSPVIIHAGPGVGKSVFSTRIDFGLPNGSLNLVYDCFGDGQYRNASAYRHRHKEALVQIANELASRGLCDPLIPTPHAELSDYMRAFLHRLKQSIMSLRAVHEDALLCIAIDAADNAQMAAEEIGEPRAFVKDLLREQFPDDVRLVLLCRTHRQNILDPPPQALRLELQPFSRAETGIYLHHDFPSATEHDVDEFHRLSSANPRVQATALSQSTLLPDILRALGPNPTTVEDTIASLLNKAVTNLRDKAGGIESAGIDRICLGLAALRPLVPISILASISGVDEAFVKSFAIELGRPLFISGDTIQFFDEPAETWFRERFKPSAIQFKTFLDILKPLASESSYVASALPQLMMEAGQFQELVDLALSSEGLPEGSPIEKRDVELQRLQFALKASLRTKRYTDAAKLALKAGGESSGDERQQKLLQANTDLAAEFMGPDRIQEIVSRRPFGGGWIGSHHVYEAGLMSGRSELLPDARSRLRMAHEWLRNWSRLLPNERKNEQILDEDIAEMAMAEFNIHGPERCVHCLSGWTPREVLFRTGRILAKRFVDHGRYDDLDYLSVVAGNDIFLLLAITLELRKVNRTPPKEVVASTLGLISGSGEKIKFAHHLDYEQTALSAIVSLVEAAFNLGVCRKEELATLLARYLPDNPPRSFYSRFSMSHFPLFRAYMLQGAFVGRTLELLDLAHPTLREELKHQKAGQDSQDVREFQEVIGSLFPWHQLWARVFVGIIPSDKLGDEIANTKATSENALKASYRDRLHTSDEIARLWFGILLQAGCTNSNYLDVFNKWLDSLERPLFTTTLTQLSRLAAQTPKLQTQSLAYAHKSFVLVRDERDNAEAKANAYVDLARAILPISISEAGAYFKEAVEVASKIGDENLIRWAAILDLADSAANPDKLGAETAYKLARCAELTYQYVDRDKHFDWEETVRAIAGLCPSSSFAILSRWRDREFGRAEKLLPIAVNFLLEHKRIDPKSALALIGFRADWDNLLLLENNLNACPHQTDKKKVLVFLDRYLRLDVERVSVLENIREVLASHDLSLPDIDKLIAFSVRKEQLYASKDGSYKSESVNSDRNTERNWDDIFLGVDMSLANDISEAYRRFKSYDPPFNHDYFFKHACQRVRVGKEAEFVHALQNIPDFELFHFREFLEQIPETWQARRAFKSALGDTLKTFCRRYCLSISKNRYFEILPFKKASEVSGIQVDEILNIILSAIGESTVVMSASRLFTLVGLLAMKLSQKEALEALGFGLNLFEDVLKDGDADGPWVENLSPPVDIEAAIAGYIWAGLAAPQASLRWEATHVVRNLCTLGQKAVLNHLIEFARGTIGGPFVDKRLHFYHLHARQWLLIALARVAKEQPSILVPHLEFFKRTAFQDEPHVLIRGFAANVVINLAENSHLQLDQSLIDSIKAINHSKLSVERSNRWDPLRNKDRLSHDRRKTRRFSFEYDMSRYWFESLGRVFAKSSFDIEEEAETIIWDDWGLEENGHWNNDERARCGNFGDGASYHSHGSYPRIDNLDFYLSYHSMMTVAGKLLATSPLHEDLDNPEDEFGSWLLNHSLSRTDGNWLADRRDPHPLEWQSWKDEKHKEDWRWSVRRDDFERCLGLSSGKLNLCGYWIASSERQEESVHIASALVSSDRSEALLRGLQTATNPYFYGFPKSNDDREIENGNFHFKGWIEDAGHDAGLDKFDPWAGSIDYPPIQPAKFVIDLFKLSSDYEKRVWHKQNKGKAEDVLWSQIWGKYLEKDDQEDEGRGKRLQASFVFIVEFLSKVKMDLIVEVNIDRRKIRSPYERHADNGLGFLPPYRRLFLIKSNGSVHGI